MPAQGVAPSVPQLPSFTPSPYSPYRPSLQRTDLAPVPDLRLINGVYYYRVVKGDTPGQIVYKAFGTIINNSEREKRGNQLAIANPAIRIGSTFRVRPLNPGEWLRWPSGWPLQLRNP